jgi:hypothetical protein
MVGINLQNWSQKLVVQQGMVAHTYNLRTQEADAKGS